MTGATLPLAAQPFVAFASLLRANGFAVAPEQTTAFLSAITLLGPRSLHDVRSAAHALFAPPPERHDEFNALFDAHFLGAVELGREIGEPDPDNLTVQEDRRGGFEPPSSDDINEAGQAATAIEALSVRRFAEADETDALRRFRRAAPEAPAAAARLSARRVQAWPRTRPAAGHEGSHPQRRRDLPPAAAYSASRAAATSSCSSTCRAR